MSAATSPALATRQEIGRSYWDRLNAECERQARAVNAALLAHAPKGGAGDDRSILIATGDEIRLTTTDVPSTRIYARLSFRSWGPVVSATVDCYEADGVRLTEEFEVPIAEDGDGEIVGLFDQGRSVCPCELAAYLLQRFTHCYPAVTLPCPESFV